MVNARLVTEPPSDIDDPLILMKLLVNALLGIFVKVVVVPERLDTQDVTVPLVPSILFAFPV